MRAKYLSILAIFGLCQAAAAADLSHEQALEAVRSGDIVPVLPIIERAEKRYSGQVIEVELTGGHDDDDAELFYRVKILTAEGRLLELLVDATTGDVVGLGGRGVGLE